MFSFEIKDAIDIFLVAIMLYYTYRFMRESRSINVFIGILVFILIWLLVSRVVEMRLLGAILDKLVGVGSLAILILFQDYECKGEEDCIILNFILQNVTLIYKQSQIEKKNLDKIISPFGMAFDYNLEPMTPEKMWYGFLFDKTSHKRVINEDTLLSLCQNCFYDADRIVGILCSYGLMLMNLNNLKS